MKTKLDELLEKWRFTASVYHGGMTHEIVTDLEAIKDSLNNPVDEPPTKPLPLKAGMTERDELLKMWMQEVSWSLDKTAVWDALNAYRKSIGKP